MTNQQLWAEQAEQDRRVQRAINESVWLMAGGMATMVGLLALIGVVFGLAASIFAGMACFATLAVLVGYDRFYGLTRGGDLW